MSEEKAELKYYERVNIPVMSINNIKTRIRDNIENTVMAWEAGLDLPRQTFHIIGPAGVGKTAICQQMADELSEMMGVNFALKMIKAPVVTRDDFIIPFPVRNEAGSSEEFRMLISDFVPTLERDGEYGLFVIDECQRGDYALQQLMWQIQNEQSVHTHAFPKGWFVIAVDNPDDGEYTMETLEDAAGLRRMLHFYTDVTAVDFLNHAIEKEFHPAVIEWVQAHPDHLYDWKSQKLGAVYANPASYERVSNILWGIEKAGKRLEDCLEYIDALVGGLLNCDKSRLFLDFLGDREDIKPQDIFRSYNKKVRGTLLKMVEAKNNAKIADVMNGFLTYLETSKPKITKKDSDELNQLTLDNIGQFLLDVPIDTGAVFINKVDSFDRKSDEYHYFTSIHVALVKTHKGYTTDFYEAMVEFQKNAVSNG